MLRFITPSNAYCFFSKPFIIFSMMIRWILLLFIGTGIFFSVQAQNKDLKIAVAANLLPPMQKLEKLFEEKYPGSATIISASSGKLTAQILNGAPYDIFIAADMQYPRKVYQEGHAQNEPDVLVQGKLVFWSKKKTAKNEIKKLLQSQSLKSIALAQPELAPYGQQAIDWLEENQLYPSVKNKIIFGENVGQINQYIHSGTVDAAFTAISAMHAPELQNTGYWVPLNVQQSDAGNLNHGIVLLTNAESDPKTINQFLEFINSPVADDIFLEFGYDIP